MKIAKIQKPSLDITALLHRVVSCGIIALSLGGILLGASVVRINPVSAATSAADNCAKKDALGYLACITKLGYGTTPANPQTPGEVVARVLGVFFGLLGVIFLVLTIYAGFTWMISRGEPAKVTTAQETLKTSVIGLAIVIAAEMLTFWVINALTQAIIR